MSGTAELDSGGRHRVLLSQRVPPTKPSDVSVVFFFFPGFLFETGFLLITLIILELAL